MDLDKYDWIADTELRHRSISQLTSYASCGEQYRLQRIAKVPQRPAAWFIQGHATHIAIEEWEKDRDATISDLEELYVDSYIEEANMYVEGWPDEGHWMTGGAKKGFQDLEDRQDKGWLQVLAYIEWARSEEHLWKVIDMEREFLVMFGEVPVRGFIDQIVEWVDGGIEPRDLKSGTKTPASGLQLDTYGKVIEGVMGIKIRGAAFVKLANPSGRTEKTKATQYIEVDLEKEAAYNNPDFLDQFYRDADRGINEGIFIPNATDGCERVCGVQQFCRLKGFGSSAEQNQRGLLPLTVK
jgi:hypothetical protein